MDFILDIFKSDDPQVILCFVVVCLISLVLLLLATAYIYYALAEIDQEQYKALYRSNRDFYQAVIDLQKKYMEKGFMRGYEKNRLYALNEKITKQYNIANARNLLK